MSSCTCVQDTCIIKSPHLEEFNNTFSFLHSQNTPNYVKNYKLYMHTNALYICVYIIYLHICMTVWARCSVPNCTIGGTGLLQLQQAILGHQQNVQGFNSVLTLTRDSIRFHRFWVFPKTLVTPPHFQVPVAKSRLSPVLLPCFCLIRL